MGNRGGPGRAGTRRTTDGRSRTARGARRGVRLPEVYLSLAGRVAGRPSPCVAPRAPSLSEVRVLRHRRRRGVARHPIEGVHRQCDPQRAVRDGERSPDAAALTGEGHYRTVAEEALALLSAIAEKAPRFAGWELVAAQRLQGECEVAVVDPPFPSEML